MQVVVLKLNFKDIFLEFFDLVEQSLWCDESSFFPLEHDGREKAKSCEFIKSGKESLEFASGKFLALGYAESKHLVKF